MSWLVCATGRCGSDNADGKDNKIYLRTSLRLRHCSRLRHCRPRSPTWISSIPRQDNWIIAPDYCSGRWQRPDPFRMPSTSIAGARPDGLVAAGLSVALGRFWDPSAADGRM